MTAIPQSVTDLVDVLATIPGTVAVVLGGSRAVRLEDEESDWDLGVYYRSEIDLGALSCERSQWVCNEKRLIETAGLNTVNELFLEIPTEHERLLEWVDLVADRLSERTR